eukprot:355468-Chlamydomonas_euryale.AAC.3
MKLNSMAVQARRRLPCDRDATLITTCARGFLSGLGRTSRSTCLSEVNVTCQTCTSFESHDYACVYFISGAVASTHRAYVDIPSWEKA